MSTRSAPRALAAVNGVFYGPFGLFSIVAQLLAPIFNGGQIRSQIHLAQAQQQQIVISYLQTVHRAFEEVSDDVVAYNESRLRTDQLKLYEGASLDSVRLANERYENGYTSYLEVLDAQTRAYQAQTDVAAGAAERTSGAGTTLSRPRRRLANAMIQLAERQRCTWTGS